MRYRIWMTTGAVLEVEADQKAVDRGVIYLECDNGSRYFAPGSWMRCEPAEAEPADEDPEGATWRVRRETLRAQLLSLSKQYGPDTPPGAAFAEAVARVDQILGKEGT